MSDSQRLLTGALPFVILVAAVLVYQLHDTRQTYDQMLGQREVQHQDRRKS